MNRRVAIIVMVQSGLLLLLLWLAVNFSPSQLIRFFEENFSTFPSDGVLSIPNSIFKKYALNILFLALAEYYLVVKWSTLKVILGRDHLLEMNGLLRAILVLSFLVFILWVPMGNRYPQLHREDGLFESITAILFLLSSFTLFAKLIWTEGKRNLWWLAPAFFFLLVGLEEISWGQRIFHWELNNFFQTYNLQDETTLHNLSYLSSTMRFFPSIAGLIFVESNSIRVWLSRRNKNVDLASIFPDRNFMIFGIGFLVIAFIATFIDVAELFEFCASLVAFGYAATSKMTPGRFR